MQKIKGMLLTGLLLASGFVWAGDNSLNYNQVQIQAEAKKEVENDTMIAVLYVEKTDKNASNLANQINKIMNAAIAQAKQTQGVELESGVLQTYPVYNDNDKLTGWRGRSELRLRSKDFAALSGLIGQLQETLLVENIDFSVSDTARTAAEDALITEGLAAFKKRAQIVQAGLNGSAYKLVNVSVNTSSQWYRPQPVLAKAKMAIMASPVQAPAAEAGKSQIQVTVSGQIEVQ